MQTFFHRTREIGNSRADNISYTLIEGDSVKDFTYREIEALMQQKRAVLVTLDATKPVLLLHSNPIEFVTSFLACQSLGLICVPMFFPRNKRHFERLKVIIEDADCEFALADTNKFDSIQWQLKKHTDAIHLVDLNVGIEEDAFTDAYRENPISFIQYTSGSTGSPKGVVVSQENLMFNEEMIANLFGCTSESTILSWLPIYHDMGLIGNILHALYTGARCVLLSPLEVIQQPSLWLRTISEYKVTHSGGPNFIYDSCSQKISTAEMQGLDLSSWKVAYNGSEPIKSDTVEGFMNKFEACGFDRNAFYTCYGLAEATLLVSGGVYARNEGPEVSSGKICDGVEVAVLDSESGQLMKEGTGEILLFGKAITEGYWNLDNKEVFTEFEGKNFLRTGDSGYIKNGELYITGRHKELIIINGKNYYPYDVESEISKSVASLETNGVIVSYLHSGASEVPIVFSEVRRNVLSTLDADSIIRAIDKVIVDELGVEAHDILLFTPHKLPRTSSGKLQRVKTKEMYQSQELDCIACKLEVPANSESEKYQELVHLISEGGNLELVGDYLIELMNTKLKLDLKPKNRNLNLMELGIDSLKSVDLVNTINQTFTINIQVTALLKIKTFSELEEMVTNLLWMKDLNSSDEPTIVL